MSRGMGIQSAINRQLIKYIPYLPPNTGSPEQFKSHHVIEEISYLGIIDVGNVGQFIYIFENDYRVTFQV